MQISIYLFEKIKHQEIENIVQHYLKLASKYAKVEFVSIKTPSDRKVELKTMEKYMTKSYNIILSEKGKNLTTEEFSKKIETIKNTNSKIAFWVANAYGFEDKVYQESDLVLALSPMTFTHEMTCAVLAEQIFRCLNLSSGGKYHK